MTGKLLDVLIPTYKRSARVLRTIESLLSVKDQRINVICSSNCFEPDLEKLRGSDSRITYSFFDVNRGAMGNFLYLLTSSTAQYCMLLSDEDELLTDAIVPFLNHLEYLNETKSDVQIIMCSVLAECKKEYFLRYPNIFQTKKLNINDALALSVLPNYMSGYVYRNSEIKSKVINDSLVYTKGNAYPMVTLALNLLNEGYLTVFNDPLVVKGSEMFVEDDEHYAQLARGEGQNQNDLANVRSARVHAPKVNSYFYSANAYARQFYFFENRLNCIRNDLNRRHYIACSLQHFLSMYISVALSETMLKNSIRGVALDCEDAFHDSLTKGEFSGSYCSKMFRVVSKKEGAILVIVAKIILKVTRISVKGIFLLPLFFRRTN